MSVRRSLISLGVALAAISCSEANAPSVPSTPLLQTTSTAMAGSVPHILRQSTGAELESYSVSFWAVKGRPATARVKYKDAQSAFAGGLTFLEFNVPKAGLDRAPNGQRIRMGDSVQITLTVDPTLLKVDFQPAGLQFSDRDPATLAMSYVGADPDFNADGTVDAADAVVASQLAIWYAPDSASSWAALESKISGNNGTVDTKVYHFSGYSVAW